MTLHEVSSKLFSDVPRAERHLHTLSEMFIGSGSYYSVEEFFSVLGKHLSLSPDPDMALNNFVRFTEATLSKASLFNDLVKHPLLMELLIKIFGFSQYFADILVRDPELFRWLTVSDSLVRPRAKEVLVAEAMRALKMFQKPQRKLDALKRLYRREILRVGARDILGEADLPAVTGEISMLADTIVDAACAVASEQLSERYPAAPVTPYAVIGLGKLGGVELNYSSDIDIIFVYKDEGEIEESNGRVSTHHEYFNKFTEKLVQNLSQPSEEGHLYRVDTRLRPESGAGPLARSMQSYLLYYESRGELWERQMLIKARPVAGDLSFGEEFLGELEPFVYPRTFFHHPAESVARIKTRIEAAVAGEENIKLRAGGIRDIEFVVQTLQLLNGGKNEQIRAEGTLPAIERLCMEELLTKDEAGTLSSAYIFFRTLEHRLQTMLNTQTHVMPQDPQTLTTIARRMGFQKADQFMARIDDQLLQVRKIFDDVLEVKEALPVATIRAVLGSGADEKTIAAVMTGYGFAETHRAAKNLRSLLSGSSLTGTRELGVRSRESFRRVAEVLFDEIAQTQSPDLTLNNLTALAGGQKFPDQLYTQLGEENFRKLILTICGTSPRFTKALAGNPLTLERLASDPQWLSGGAGSPPKSLKGLAEFKNNSEVRAGLRHLLGITTLDEMARELSYVADSVMRVIFAGECKKQKLAEPPLAILALGKYGTMEINFDADLDLIFISEERAKTRRDKLEKIATRVVGALSEVSERGKLYDVDARLRPEGKSSPLVVDKEAYASYLQSRASLWERQSLTRLRFVCGDEELGHAVEKDVEAFVYESPLPATWVDEIVAMRRKIETRSRVRSSDYFDLKLGAGGLVDVEFVVQMVQLKAGQRMSDLRGKRTLELLEQTPVLLGERTTFFKDSYRMYRTLEFLMRVTLEEKGTLLPEGEKLELLAKMYDGSSAGALRKRVDETMKNVRRQFLDTAHMIPTL